MWGCRSALSRSSGLGIQCCRPKRHIRAVPQCHRHLSGRAVYSDVTEELHAGRWRQVLLVPPWRLDELHFWPEGVVEFVRTIGPRMKWAGNAFPEWHKLLKLRLVWFVIMRGGA